MRRNIIKFNWRYWVLMMLASVAVIAIMLQPTEDNEQWLAILLLTKAVALAAIGLSALLFRYWTARHKIDLTVGDNSDIMKED